MTKFFLSVEINALLFSDELFFSEMILCEFLWHFMWRDLRFIPSTIRSRKWMKHYRYNEVYLKVTFAGIELTAESWSVTHKSAVLGFTWYSNGDAPTLFYVQEWYSYRLWKSTNKTHLKKWLPPIIVYGNAMNSILKGLNGSLEPCPVNSQTATHLLRKVGKSQTMTRCTKTANFF